MFVFRLEGRVRSIKGTEMTNRTLRRNAFGLLLLFVMGLFSLSASVSAQPTREFGSGANANFYDPSGSYSGTLIVQALKLPGRDVNDVFFGYAIEFGSFMLQGNGRIPADAFKIFGQNGDARLEIDTSTVSDFVSIRCNIDPWYCEDVPGGLISVEWVGNGVYKELNEGISRIFSSQIPGPFTQHFTGWVATSNASGNLNGFTFETQVDSQEASVSGSHAMANVKGN